MQQLAPASLLIGVLRALYALVAMAKKGHGIVLAWLITRDEPDLFAAYQEHGRGNLKLLREHLKEDMREDPDQEEKDFLDVLDARVNAERDEWFQPVNLGSFSRA